MLFLRSRCHVFRNRKGKQTHLDAMFVCGLHTSAKLFVEKEKPWGRNEIDETMGNLGPCWHHLSYRCLPLVTLLLRIADRMKGKIWRVEIGQLAGRIYSAVLCKLVDVSGDHTIYFWMAEVQVRPTKVSFL